MALPLLFIFYTSIFQHVTPLNTVLDCFNNVLSWSSNDSNNNRYTDSNNSKLTASKPLPSPSLPSVWLLLQITSRPSSTLSPSHLTDIKSTNTPGSTVVRYLGNAVAQEHKCVRGSGGGASSVASSSAGGVPAAISAVSVLCLANQPNDAVRAACRCDPGRE